MRPGWQLDWVNFVSIVYSLATARQASHENISPEKRSWMLVSFCDEREYLAIVRVCTKTTLQLFETPDIICVVPSKALLVCNYVPVLSHGTIYGICCICFFAA